MLADKVIVLAGPKEVSLETWSLKAELWEDSHGGYCIFRHF